MHAARGHHPQAMSTLANAEGPVGVLAVGEERLVEEPVLVEHGARDEHRRAADAVGLPQLVESPVVALAVAALAAVVTAARVIARAGEPDHVGRIGKQDLRAQCPGVRTAGGLHEQRRQEARLDHDETSPLGRHAASAPR